VAVAGTLRVRGANASGRPWGIAIEAPSPGSRSAQRVLPLSVGAVSTSGDYRNFFEQGGRRYSHHIDPRTGESVAHRVASASVVLPADTGSAMRADGLATALVVLGEEAGPALAESLGLAAFFIIRQGDGLTELTTSAFDRIESPRD
jgi:thiamine biosynthesis lipoprotein